MKTHRSGTASASCWIGCGTNGFIRRSPGSAPAARSRRRSRSARPSTSARAAVERCEVPSTCLSLRSDRQGVAPASPAARPPGPPGRRSSVRVPGRHRRALPRLHRREGRLAWLLPAGRSRVTGGPSGLALWTSAATESFTAPMARSRCCWPSIVTRDCGLRMQRSSTSSAKKQSSCRSTRPPQPTLSLAHGPRVTRARTFEPRAVLVRCRSAVGTRQDLDG